MLQYICAVCLISRSCPTLGNPMDCSLPVYSVHGQYSVQARILEWVAMPSSRGSSQPRGWTQVSLIAGRFFTNWAPGKLVMLHICNVTYYYFSEHTCKWDSLFLFIIKREKQDLQVLRGRMDLEENLWVPSGFSSKGWRSSPIMKSFDYLSFPLASQML